LLTRPGLSPGVLAEALEQAMRALKCSSAHVTFCTEGEWQALGEAGWLQRIGMQFHWHNAGYASFEDFLAALSSRKRKQLRRERRAVAEAGLTLRALRGAEIAPHHWRAFHRFYLNTVEHRWGGAYLTEGFWPLLGERLGELVVLMWAEREGKPVAGALNLLGRDALYGRNWGCAEEVPFLHFELCYLQAIEFAIAHRIPRVEAGAQGEHKIQRGYLPVPTYSAHLIAHPGLRAAVAAFLDAERPAMRERMAALMQDSPYRQAGCD
jgi:predicted N-acyltransferase